MPSHFQFQWPETLYIGLDTFFVTFNNTRICKGRCKQIYNYKIHFLFINETAQRTNIIIDKEFCRGSLEINTAKM